MKDFKEIKNAIGDLDTKAMERAKKRLDNLVKPVESLGVMEDVVIQLAGISGDEYYCTDKKAITIMSSDNGVIAEGIASSPQFVTYAQTINFTKGLTGVSVLAKEVGADLFITDVGINGELSHPEIRNKKINMGTKNIAIEDAMTYEEAEKAINVGIELVNELSKKGYKIVGLGEMGIGNTTTSSAIISALTGRNAQETVGRGAGLSDEALQKKIKVVNKAIERCTNKDPVAILAQVGGYDIAALVGVCIGCAYKRIPVVIDGFISIVAAAIAFEVNPKAKNFMISSHLSVEQGYKITADYIGLEPSINLHLRLGEGSGAAIMFKIIEFSQAIFKNMGTFEEANIDLG
ncbi:MAG: nicotinate-nucleotide--dimethylbenzimidazole phosphoribosyltransferase [Lachnospirales bacterium]